jgi:hypothetical protein
MKRSQNALWYTVRSERNLKCGLMLMSLQRPYWVALDVTCATGVARNVGYDPAAIGKGLWHNLLSCLNGQLKVL